MSSFGRREPEHELAEVEPTIEDLPTTRPTIYFGLKPVIDVDALDLACNQIREMVGDAVRMGFADAVQDPAYEELGADAPA